MEIKDIKSQLSIGQVLSHYGITVKNKHCCCPFHDDKTPSMQVYEDTNTVHCFSGNCDQSGKAIDVIDFILHKEAITKAEAILKAKHLIGVGIIAQHERDKNHKANIVRQSFSEGGSVKSTNTPDEVFSQLQGIYGRSEKAKGYIRSRNLPEGMEIGYKSPGSKLIKGMNNCVIFPLRDCHGQIVSYYGRRIASDEKGKHYYSSNRSGLYPCYPSAETRHLILTESIIDAATLMHHVDLSGLGSSVLSLYGTNGFTTEHSEALSQLTKLEEITLFLDGDEAGRKSTEKQATTLKELLPHVKISGVVTPEGEDPNSLVESHEPSVLHHLLKERRTIHESNIVRQSFSEGGSGQSAKSQSLKANSSEGQSATLSSATLVKGESQQLGANSSQSQQPRPEHQNQHPTPKTLHLNTDNPDQFTYKSGQLQASVLGGMSLYPLDKLKVTLKIEKQGSSNPLHKVRQNIDLYQEDQVEKLSKKVAERLEIGTREAQSVLYYMIDALEGYRMGEIEKKKVDRPTSRLLSKEQRKKAIDFLSAPDLLKRTSELIGKSGMVGEEGNRLLMYLVFTSRLREQPLHIVSLGSSGTGKTYLQEKISALIPATDRLEITALSENALYYFQKEELKHKLVLIEDLDGASDDKVLFAIRELQSKKRISKTIPIKDSKGNLKTVTVQVEGPISLAGTTTREKLYEDNANRSLLIYLDNSKAHKEAIMDYQRAMSAGQVNKREEREVRDFFKDMQVVLEPVQVRNPYALDLKIPETVFKPLRTNAHYLAFIETITFYHQLQRERKYDSQSGSDYIETTIEDIRAANHLLKDVLLAKSDELTKACRDFFEILKGYLLREEKTSFYSKEIRSIIKISPTSLNRHLLALVKYDYLRVVGGNRARGYEYEVVDVKEYERLRNSVGNALDDALLQLKLQCQ